MLSPPSEVNVSHEKYVKKIEVRSSSPTISNGTFSDSKIKGYLGLIWDNWGLKRAHLRLKGANLAQMGQLGSKMGQLGGQMGQVGVQIGQLRAPMGHLGAQMR